MRTAGNAVTVAELLSPSDVSADAEMQVLACVARGSLSPRHEQELKTLLAGDVDWVRLHRLAFHHKLMPLLYWHLRAHVDAALQPAFSQLGAGFLDNACRMLALSAELVAVVKALEEQGITCVPYKGPALAAGVYGNVALRQAGDLDVVVRRGDLPPVRDLLRSRGYSPEHRLSGRGEQLMEQTLYHEGFYRPDGFAFEVHWGFTDKHLGFVLGLEVLEPRLQTVRLGGAELPAFSREDLLLVLCVHGAKHRWSRLEWVAAVAELLRSNTSTDWPVLIQRARGLGSHRVLLLGLRMASELLDAPLPPDVQAMAFRDTVVATQATVARQLLWTDPVLRDLAAMPPPDIFYLALNDRRRDKLRFLLHRLTTPSQAKSWRGVRVGPLYLPLHRISRPLGGWRILASTLWWLIRNGLGRRG